MREIVLPPRWQPRPPPKLPGKPSKGDIEISVTEIGSFLRCRRAWDIQSPGRHGLRRKGPPAPALQMGGALHFAFAAQALGDDPLAAVDNYFVLGKAQLEELYRKRVGSGFSYQEIELFDQQRLLVRYLVQAYFAKYGTDWPTKPYRIVAPEVTFRIPLLPDQPVYLIGTIDRILADEFDSPIPCEIKTYKSKPNRNNWQFNHQLYGYAAALQILLDLEVPYACYDGVRKTEPTEPKVLKSGYVSQRWIDTTYERYLATVLEVHGEVPDRYDEFLQRLKRRDRSNDNAFVTRFRIPISQYAINKWWDRAQIVGREIANYPLIFPYFDWQGCPFCRVKDLCYAIEGGDQTHFKWLLRNEYERSTTPTREATKIATPETVHNLGDLAAWSHRKVVKVTLEEADSDVALYT